MTARRVLTAAAGTVAALLASSALAYACTAFSGTFTVSTRSALTPLVPGSGGTVQSTGVDPTMEMNQVITGHAAVPVAGGVINWSLDGGAFGFLPDIGSTTRAVNFFYFNSTPGNWGWAEHYKGVGSRGWLTSGNQIDCMNTLEGAVLVHSAALTMGSGAGSFSLGASAYTTAGAGGNVQPSGQLNTGESVLCIASEGGHPPTANMVPLTVV